MKQCLGCKKPIEDWLNYCDWDCHVEAVKQDGGVLHCPNGLPVRCINAKGLMLECEHGDHPDYKFPVIVSFVPEPDKEYDRDEMHDCMHALIYTDGTIAVTMHECNYGIFSLRDGLSISGPDWGWKRGRWKLDEESLKKARSLRDE